jgi:hypothetical protein
MLLVWRMMSTLEAFLERGKRRGGGALACGWDEWCIYHFSSNTHNDSSSAGCLMCRMGVCIHRATINLKQFDPSTSSSTPSTSREKKEG